MMQSLKEMLSEPVEAVKYRERHALESLLASRNYRTVLFGTGGLGKRALGQLRGIGIEPLALSDNKKSLWGTELGGLMILEPTEAASRFGTDASFIITIWNEFHYFNETAEQLRSIGCSQVIPYTYLHWRFPEEFLPSLLNDLPHKVYEDHERVWAAENMWEDSQSHDIFCANIRFRAMGEPQDLPPRPVENTYLPLDILRPNDSERFLDCGATGGEMTQEVLHKYGSHFSEFHAIEADRISFRKLESYFGRQPQYIREKLKPYNCAVGDKRAVVPFSNTGQTGSKISDDGVAVDCFPIDELFANTSLTYLKMDIEGAEYDALLGGRNVIQRDQPILAICVYHTQNDIWRIPLLVRDMLPKHRLYLRAYEGDGFQTVLYAVPRDRALQNT